jgi:hypothetical protein
MPTQVLPLSFSGKDSEDATTEAKTNKDGRGPRRESENNAAKFIAETAGSPKGTNTGLG